MKKPSTQFEAIKMALVSGEKLSSLNAFHLTGCTRLPARISDLIEEKWHINKEWKSSITRFGTTCTYIEYSLDKSKTNPKLIEQYEEYKYFTKSNGKYVMK